MRFDKIQNDEHRITKWLERCHLLITLHSKMSSILKRRYFAIGIIIIILAGVASFPIFNKYSLYFFPVIIILASLQTFVGWGEEAKQHLITSKMYGDVMRKLEVEKSKDSHNQIDLSNIQNQIDLINHFAPIIDPVMFSKEDELLRKRLEEHSTLVSPITITKCPISANDLTESHLNLEKKYFGVYASCPKSISEYVKDVADSELFMVELKRDGAMVGFALWQRINNEIFHLYVIVVDEPYRKLGYGKSLIEHSLELIKSQGGIYATLFTADEYLFNSLFRDFSDPVGSGNSLNNDEMRILRQIESYRKLQKNIYGDKRVIDDYYKMKDGKSRNASFRVFRL